MTETGTTVWDGHKCTSGCEKSNRIKCLEKTWSEEINDFKKKLRGGVHAFFQNSSDNPGSMEEHDFSVDCVCMENSPIDHTARMLSLLGVRVYVRRWIGFTEYDCHYSIRIDEADRDKIPDKFPDHLSLELYNILPDQK